MWKRPILNNPQRASMVSQELQSLLFSLLDFAHAGKQAHWNLYGRDFLATHEKLDEIVESSRSFADLVAERIVKLGFAADGRTAAVAEHSKMPEMPTGFDTVEAMQTAICERLKVLVDQIRSTQEQVAEMDAMSEDLVIEIGREFETHLWMMQAMEGTPPAAG